MLVTNHSIHLLLRQQFGCNKLVYPTFARCIIKKIMSAPKKKLSYNHSEHEMGKMKNVRDPSSRQPETSSIRSCIPSWWMSLKSAIARSSNSVYAHRHRFRFVRSGQFESPTAAATTGDFWEPLLTYSELEPHTKNLQIDSFLKKIYILIPG